MQHVDKVYSSLSTETIKIYKKLVQNFETSFKFITMDKKILMVVTNPKDILIKMQLSNGFISITSL